MGIIYGIPKSKLQRRRQYTRKTKTCHFEPVFDGEFEKEAVDYSIEMQTMFFGLTSDALRSLAYELSERNGIVHPFN